MSASVSKSKETIKRVFIVLLLSAFRGNVFVSKQPFIAEIAKCEQLFK